MPTTPSQLDDVEKPEAEEPVVDPGSDSEPIAPLKPGEPLSFVPHEPDGRPAVAPIRIRTNRFGDLDEHELVRLLDTIEDERARGRFRESIYISVFVWMVIVWVIFYGPKYLWHAPTLISPVEVMKQQQMTSLNAPVLPRHFAAPPKVDNRTLAKLRDAEPKPSPTPPAPAPPTPAPAPAATQPQPTTTPTAPLPSAPTPVPTRTPAPVIAEAPVPQPTKPNFNTSGSASDEMRNEMRNAARNPGAGLGDRGGPIRTPKGAGVGGGAQIISDTMGVDFNPWLRRFQSDVMRNWIPLLPEETAPPLSKKGNTFLIVTILKDGSIGDMKLENSSHDVAIDRSTWASITSEGKFEGLPKVFPGPSITLRLYYSVNEDVR
jgi:hypothetical protein